MNINLDYIRKLLLSIADNGEVILNTVNGIEPYLAEMLAVIKNGGEPTDEQWDALNARLDAGSAELAAAVKKGG